LLYQSYSSSNFLKELFKYWSGANDKKGEERTCPRPIFKFVLIFFILDKYGKFFLKSREIDLIILDNIFLNFELKKIVKKARFLVIFSAPDSFYNYLELQIYVLKQ
jgi:hypothetical protein|tara:strand:+ start:702 stop:1019 length:318 start_codon:yes stop_codon:yes gene_type:complete